MYQLYCYIVQYYIKDTMLPRLQGLYHIYNWLSIGNLCPEAKKMQKYILKLGY